MLGTAYFERIASLPPLTKLHPKVGAFFRDYLKGEKAIEFGGQLVVNTHFPPWPGRAFEALAEQLIEASWGRRLYSVTVALTNRCPFACWHCYNAGRSQKDIGTAHWQRLAAELQDRGAVIVTLTGGEPLLRDDLEEIAASFDERTCVILGTTGWGLTQERAHALKAAGFFAVGISLDSADEAEHDRLRGRPGAFRAALRALSLCAEAGLYPYVVTVARRELLAAERFLPFMRFVGEQGGLEVHLLEPCPAGRLKGDTEVPLKSHERARILDLQHEVARREDLPILSSFTYLERPEAFGCGAGLTHLYIDGGGEVCPCNLVPLSFGNICDEALAGILERMGRHFCHPRPKCLGRLLTPHIDGSVLPVPPERSLALCEKFLPQEHPLPLFFQTQRDATSSAGRQELAQSYDGVHADYDRHWLCEAGRAVEDLVRRMNPSAADRILEAGCGTGYGTALLAKLLDRGGRLLAVDLSAGMLAMARQRLKNLGLANVEFFHGDALEALSAESGLDGVFTSWVLGYIPLTPFFAAAARALRPGGKLALVVHREDSPQREWRLFAELVAEDPSLLIRQVAFDFPRHAGHLESELAAAGFVVDDLWQDVAAFRYAAAEEVLEHLLKSGAGTVFYEAVDPTRLDALEQEFLARLQAMNGAGMFEVRHDYLGCIAKRPDL